MAPGERVPPPGPVALPPSPWVFDPRAWPDDDDCVAVGADLEPSTVVAAYRAGAFPMPVEDVDPMLWWSPVERGVLELADLHVSRSLRRSLRRFVVTHDTAFADVVDACADPSRPGAWIDAEIRDAYVRLHHLGWAHSVEVREDGVLVGGLYGLSLGGLFAGESMFHHATDASKAALVGLVERLDDAPASQRLVDVQWQTPHLSSLGVTTLPRAAYLARLPGLVGAPTPGAWSGSVGRQAYDSGDLPSN